MEAVIIVGDRFENFAKGKDNVLTMNELSASVWKGEFGGDRALILGQGVEHDRLHGVLLTLKRRHGRDVQIRNIEHVNDLCDPAHQAAVHKHRAENILISKPKRVDDDHYVAALCIQDANEFLGDHITGQHLQGILLAEAGRQMLLATSEHYLLEPEFRGHSYFVLNTFGTEFLRFAFPVPIRIDFSVLSQDRKPGRSLRVASETNFYQDGELVAKVNCSYCAYAATYIAAREAELALAACACKEVDPLASTLRHRPVHGVAVVEGRA